MIEKWRKKKVKKHLNYYKSFYVMQKVMAIVRSLHGITNSSLQTGPRLFKVALALDRNTQIINSIGT